MTQAATSNLAPGTGGRLGAHPIAMEFHPVSNVVGNRFGPKITRHRKATPEEEAAALREVQAAAEQEEEVEAAASQEVAAASQEVAASASQEVEVAASALQEVKTGWGDQPQDAMTRQRMRLAGMVRPAGWGETILFTRGHVLKSSEEPGMTSLEKTLVPEVDTVIIIGTMGEGTGKRGKIRLTREGETEGHERAFVKMTMSYPKERGFWGLVETPRYWAGEPDKRVRFSLKLELENLAKTKLTIAFKTEEPLLEFIRSFGALRRADAGIFLIDTAKTGGGKKSTRRTKKRRTKRHNTKRTKKRRTKKRRNTKRRTTKRR